MIFKPMLKISLTSRMKSFLISKNTGLSVSLIFTMQRPKYHYVACDPNKKKLKDSAPQKIYVAKKDVENRAKFVLDSLNGIVYKDDAQIVHLSAFKVYADVETNLGCTHINIKVITDEDVQSMINVNI